ncbi:MAG TPA: biotin--[acetyl-CoA-carboxylase] ligase [Anaerolineae bacterium]|nr:biotin--[acetyl-CoA-carboxylase] ligase [Anaerolineae bacterium]HQI86880.1 biotin--[acetyl-CoA-carboxylase] ligase [Anaerolineae bacterium]
MKRILGLHDYHREGWDICYFERLDSTNTALLDAGRQGALEGLVYIADEQTAGRGRLDRRWVAPPGTCLLLSLLFRPPEPFTCYAPRLTMLCGMAMADAVETVSGVAVQLKWPNDLIITEPGMWRKLAGMLSEIGSGADNQPFLVVGIGLNVNVPAELLPDLAPNATSLLAETGRSVERVALLDVFLGRVEAYLAALYAGRDPLPLWRRRLAWIGDAVLVQMPTGSVEGIAEDVDDAGALLLRLPDGRLQHFAVGDVSLRV